MLEESTELVFERWEKAVRERVKAARETEAMALRDHLPLIYGEILDATRLLAKEGGRGREVAKTFLGNPAHQEHGRLRASIKGYSVESLIQEYYILEEVICDRLDEKQMWNREIAETIHYLVQQSVTTTAEIFSEALELMQQRMLGTLVHDIRTPLAAATMAGELLKEGKVEGSARDQLDGISRESVARALEMLSGLLDTVMTEAGDGLMMDFREADFTEEFENAIKEARAIYGSQIAAEIPGEAIQGVFDPAALRRIMENLISNAVRYGTAKNPVTLTLKDQGKDVSISVHNTGNPIARTRREKIFEFFSSRSTREANKAKDSWGIGLSFIRLAVDGHGGGVTLHSDAEEGTTFEVTLSKTGNKAGKVRTRLIEPGAQE